ncbi:MAG TPA: DUF2510 domain-containing protein [Acidimicrobiales bacterium]|nr:DUF2510 domain-containing protein [Acidimicrobiales bacterium]
MAEAGWYPDEQDAALLRWWDGQQWTGHVRDARPDPPPQDAAAAAPGRRAGGKVSTVVAVLLVALIWPGFPLVMLGGGLYILNVQRSGTPAEATVTECHRVTRRSTVCNGTWTVGDLAAGGTVVQGTIEGANRDDVGETLDVRVSGDRAYTRSLRLPVVLIGFAAVLLALPLFSRGKPWIQIVRRQPAGTGPERPG